MDDLHLLMGKAIIILEFFLKFFNEKISCKLLKERFDITFIKYKKSCYNINFFFIKYFLQWFIKKCY